MNNSGKGGSNPLCRGELSFPKNYALLVKSVKANAAMLETLAALKRRTGVLRRRGVGCREGVVRSRRAIIDKRVSHSMLIVFLLFLLLQAGWPFRPVSMTEHLRNLW